MYGHRSSFAQPYVPAGGRSPYGAYAQPTPTDRRFTELYDYVDEDRNVLSPSARNAPVFDDEDLPDHVHIKCQGDSWTHNFPPFSIAEEKVTVRHVRERVASRLGYMGQEGRVKLMYKDRELKSNEKPLRHYGCKQNSEISVILMQESKNWDRKHNSGSDNESIGSARRSVEEARPRRSNSTYRRRDSDSVPGNERRNGNSGHLHPQSAHSTPPTSSTPVRQSSPVRPNAQRQPPRQSSPVMSPPSRAPAVQPPTADPSTMLGKIQTIGYEFWTQWYPPISEFMRSPPTDKDDRVKEYRRLSEVVYKKVFEAGDAIEAGDGPDKNEIRATRKKLFNDVQIILKDLDDKFKPREGK